MRPAACPPTRRQMLRLISTLPLWGCGTCRAQARPVDGPLEALLRRGGVALLLRHAITTPGLSDPPGFRLGDCATQRNLSEEGRGQAGRIGLWFRQRELVPAHVLCSAWCRCQDTARLAFGGSQHWAPLDSLVGRHEHQDAAVREMAARLGRLRAGTFEVWVTHQVNIHALAGEPVAMGQALIAAAGSGRPGVTIAGRLSFD
ncbi:MAG TPA: histidine phosphatase family protein [Burkholderiaceae bacterium]|nr:histidine phosphatase family protein [Burkholderiaceae bacterium]